MTTTTSSTSTAVAVAEPVFSPQERLALAGFLAGYTGLTREAYALDLRQYASWFQLRHLRLFQARRADIECFARDLETRGRARATITRRLCTIAGFYRYAVEEELLEHSPAAHVRRPRLDYESHATRLDRNELGAILVAAGLGAAAEHALISLLALNGLRVSEHSASVGSAPSAWPWTPDHHRKGSKVVRHPAGPRLAWTIVTVGEQAMGLLPWLLMADGWTGTARRIVRRTSRRYPKPRAAHRAATSIGALMLSPQMSKKPPPTLTQGPRSATTVPGSLDRHATYIVSLRRGCVPATGCPAALRWPAAPLGGGPYSRDSGLRTSPVTTKSVRQPPGGVRLGAREAHPLAPSPITTRAWRAALPGPRRSIHPDVGDEPRRPVAHGRKRTPGPR
jgi:hypothetical protein